MLRLLEPLNLPEQTRVQVHVQTDTDVVSDLPDDGDEHRKRVDEVLRQAGMLVEPKERRRAPPLSSAERLQLAREAASAGPLSEVIIEEREGR